MSASEDGRGQSTAPPAPQHRSGEDPFVSRVLSWHQPVPYTSGPLPMCACGAVSRLCGYVNAAHELLDYPVPWDDRPAQPLPPFATEETRV